jgi:hypothetical protein
VNRTHVVLRDYFNIDVERLGVLLCGLLLLFSWANARLFAKRFRWHVVLRFPAIADLAFYATMRVEGRFRAGYTIALFAACIAPLRITDLPNSAEFTGAVALALSSVLFALAGVEAGHEAISGDRVGYMGDALSDHGWAYVAGVKIAAEIPLEDTLSFWGADREQRDEAWNWLASTGARVLVTRDAPNTAMPMGWRKSGRYGLLRSATAGSGTSKIARRNA